MALMSLTGQKLVVCSKLDALMPSVVTGENEFSFSASLFQTILEWEELSAEM